MRDQNSKPTAPKRMPYMEWQPDTGKVCACIPLTKDRVALIDVEDLPLVMQYPWRATTRTRNTYASYDAPVEGQAKQKTILLHRLILGFPDGCADHINGNGLDNRRCNLRAATFSGNTQNGRKRTGTVSKYKGVTVSRNHWKASIRSSKKDYHLGVFDREADAARAYDAAARRMFGEFANCNFPLTDGNGSDAVPL